MDPVKIDVDVDQELELLGNNPYNTDIGRFKENKSGRSKGCSNFYKILMFLLVFIELIALLIGFTAILQIWNKIDPMIDPTMNIINKTNHYIPSIINIIDKTTDTLPGITNIVDKINTNMPEITSIVNNINNTIPYIEMIVGNINNIDEINSLIADIPQLINVINFMNSSIPELEYIISIFKHKNIEIVLQNNLRALAK